jgi:hypothetical protein
MMQKYFRDFVLATNCVVPQTRSDFQKTLWSTITALLIDRPVQVNVYPETCPDEYRMDAKEG